jgi:hypothetical protein
LSDHRYFANLFRLYLHTAGYNLLVRMRHVIELFENRVHLTAAENTIINSVPSPIEPQATA